MSERKEKMGKGKERTSLSGRHATDNKHQHATRKKPKGKYPIQKGKMLPNERGKAIAKEGNNVSTLFVVFVFSLLAYSIASIEYQNTGY